MYLTNVKRDFTSVPTFIGTPCLQLSFSELADKIIDYSVINKEDYGGGFFNSLIDRQLNNSLLIPETSIEYLIEDIKEWCGRYGRGLAHIDIVWDVPPTNLDYVYKLLFTFTERSKFLINISFSGKETLTESLFRLLETNTTRLSICTYPSILEDPIDKANLENTLKAYNVRILKRADSFIFHPNNAEDIRTITMFLGSIKKKSVSHVYLGMSKLTELGDRYALLNECFGTGYKIMQG